MTSSIGSITFDCENAVTLAEFWAAVLGAEVDPDERNTGMFFQSIGRSADQWAGPIMMFIKVPEGKTAKNRVHLDLTTADRAAEVERLMGLGATEVAARDEWGMSWTTLTDPEGNEFCVAETPH